MCVAKDDLKMSNKAVYNSFLNHYQPFDANILNDLQQDLEVRRMANHMDSIPSYHTPKERQLAAVPELRIQDHQSYQPS